MKINKKIVLYLLTSFFLVAALLSIASLLLINHSQQNNIRLFKQEFVELGTEYFGNNSTTFYNGLEGLLANAKPATQTAIGAVSELDPQDANTFIINLSSQRVIYGSQNSNFISLLNKSQLNNFIQQYLLNQITEFDTNNYSAFLADNNTQLIPGEVHLKVYGNYGLIIGYGQTFNTGAVRIDYIQRQNQALFKDEILLSLAVFVTVTLVSVSFMILKMRKTIIIPIQAITLGLRQIEQGFYDTRISVNTSDEMGKIATVFNQMAGRIQTLITNLNLSRGKIEDQYHDLRHEQIRLTASIESLDVGLIMTGANNEVIMINHVSKNILSGELTAEGVAKTPGSAQPLTTEIIQARLAKFLDFKGELAKLATTAKPIQIDGLDYNGRIIKLFMAPVLEAQTDDNPAEKLGAVILLEDITEEKIAERSKDEFFSIASHELRTPLTAIRGNSSLMQSYFADVLKNNGMDEMVDDIHSSSVRLIAIVNDFLDASRLEQGKIQYHFESFPIEKVIETVVHELGSVSKSRGVEVKFTDSESSSTQVLPSVYGDRDRVKQSKTV